MTFDSLEDRVPAESLFETLRQAMPDGDSRGVLARLFGVHPIPELCRSWYTGAIGELAVARVLGTLPTDWLVLHSVPVGDRRSDIDHVLITPTGRVITINTKHHDGATIWVGAKTVMVNGQKQPYLRNSKHEADRAARYLTAATGHPVAALGMIVIVGAKKLTVRQEPDDVAVVQLEHLKRFLTRELKTTPSDSDRARLRAAAVAPGTWTTQQTDTPDPTLVPWFDPVSYTHLTLPTNREV